MSCVAEVPRPKCRQCDKPLVTVYENKYETKIDERGTETRHFRGRVTGHGYAGRGHFCSLRCGWRFAIDTVEGTR